MSKRSASSNEGSNDGSTKRIREDYGEGDSAPSTFASEEGGNTNDDNNSDLFKIETSEGADFGTLSWDLEEGGQEVESGSDSNRGLLDPGDLGVSGIAGSPALPTSSASGLPSAAAVKRESDLVSNAGSETSTDEDTPLEELFAAVMTAQDGDGRQISTMFQLLPSKDDYPDYYEYIKEPIDLKMIGTKIQSGAYSTLTDLEKDLVLMVKNAKYYNEPGSQVYRDANFIRRVIGAKKSEIEQRKYQPLKTSERIKAKKYAQHSSGQKWSAVASALKYDAVDTNTGSTNQSFLAGDELANIEDDAESDAEDDAVDNPMYHVFEAVRSFKDEAGNVISGPFMRLPNKRFYPDYYMEIKNPISLSQVQKRIKLNAYRDAAQLVDDLSTMFENAKKYNRPDSKIFENTCILQKMMLEKAKEYLGYDPNPEDPDVDDEEEDDEDPESDAEEVVEEDPLIDDSSKISEFPDDIPVLGLEDIVKPEEPDISQKSTDDAGNEESNDFSGLNISITSTGSVSASSASGYGNTGLSVTVKKKVAKRLVTGYIIFASEVRKSVVQQNPDCNFGDISRIIGTEWKNLPTDVKAEYEKKAQRQNEITAANSAKEAMEKGPQSPSAMKQVIQNAVYECHWQHKCDYQCEDTDDLTDHLTSEPNGHVWRSYGPVKDKEETIFQCLFHGCGRVKKGAVPFPSITRLIRHIKEVHVSKQNPKSIPPEKRGRNFHPSKNNTYPYPPPVSQVDFSDSNSLSSPEKHGESSNPPTKTRQGPCATPRDPNLIYSCNWEGKCKFKTIDTPVLLDHLTNEQTGHVWKSYGKDKEKQGDIFQCLFIPCGRVKKGAVPFPSITRLIRHVKEIHVTKQKPKPINTFRSSDHHNTTFHHSKNAVIAPAPQSLPQQVGPAPQFVVGPQPIQQIIVSAPSMQPIHSQTTRDDSIPLLQSFWIPPAPAPQQQPPTPQGVAVQSEHLEPLFMKPQTPRLVHSSAFIKYVERLKPDSPNVSNWETQLKANSENTLPDKTILPVSWLANGAGSHGNVVDALWALRSFMMADCLTLAKGNE